MEVVTPADYVSRELVVDERPVVLGMAVLAVLAVAATQSTNDSHCYSHARTALLVDHCWQQRRQVGGSSAAWCSASVFPSLSCVDHQVFFVSVLPARLGFLQHHLFPVSGWQPDNIKLMLLSDLANTWRAVMR